MTEQEKQIREEAGDRFPEMSELGFAQREAYIAAVTKERERAKMLAIEFNKWCNREFWKHEHAEQRTFTDDEKYLYFIKQYNQ